MSLRRRLRLETWFGDGLFLATVLWILFGALPILAILVASLVTGDHLVEGQPVPDGFPAFMPPWWAAYPQTVLLIVLTIGSIPLPLRGRRAATRGTLELVLALSATSTFFIMAAAGLLEARAGRLNFFGLDILAGIQALLFLLTVLRMLLGWLRLVPQAWRQYLDDDGTVIPPREFVRMAPPRPWDGRIRVNGKRL